MDDISSTAMGMALFSLIISFTALIASICTHNKVRMFYEHCNERNEYGKILNREGLMELATGGGATSFSGRA